MNPFLLTDAYKISHPKQYPANTEYVYSNITARKSRMRNVHKVVVFGVRWFIQKYLVEGFNQHFFNRPKDEVMTELQDFFDNYFGPGSVDVSIYGDLHDLGYLPLKIKAIAEGCKVPTGVPFMTIMNTHPRFYWLTNFIETLSQTVLWNCITSATIANRYRIMLDAYAEMTSSNPDFVQFQGHNFSMRGMSSVESGITSDLGHLLSFVGSDTLPGNYIARKYYDAQGLVSCSVPATEHAVMCAGGKEDERETFRRLIQDTYPSGIVSIVSDTWDLWKVLTEIAPSLRTEIEARDGKVVFRPDSGDPVKIICGYQTEKTAKTVEEMRARLLSISGQMDASAEAYECCDGFITREGVEVTENEILGCMRLLDREFGSTVNDKGFKELNPKVGLIYGDSITFERAEKICIELKDLGFASTNIVFGIGSYTYQYNTRDTFSIACKATWVQVAGEARPIFKDPATDDGTKKSAYGLLYVGRENGEFTVEQNVSEEKEKGGCLELAFVNGLQLTDRTFGDIRLELAAAN